MKEITSQGKCIYCQTLVAEKEMAKHLKAHLKQASHAAPNKSYLAYVNGGPGMFLYLLVNHQTKLKDIDNFLRKIWLDCCGHLSGFKPGKMNDLVSDIYPDIKKLNYTYDFGTSTYIEFKIIASYDIEQKEKVKLLSRNEPLKIMCRSCFKKPAAEICTVHLWEENQGFYCQDCGVKHEEECEDFSDYAKMPLVNSPRMGECGYTGGQIDLSRDGAYQLK